MQLDVIILGASGYGGGELLRWLSGHPNVRRIRGTSRSAGGKPFHVAHPNLRGLLDGTYAASMDWSEISGQAVVFSALPHGELAKTIGDLDAQWRAAGIADQLLLIDLSTDFRADARFVYGLPEWNREAITGAKRVASPGCFATALQLGLLPLRGTSPGFIAASGVTGSSGSGTSATAGTHHPTRANDFRAYKVLTHQHIAEVERAMSACDIRGNVAFVPHSGPFVRGIFVTLQFRMPPELGGHGLGDRARQAFEHCPFVRIVEETPRIAAVAGSNFADVAVTADKHSGAIMIALDNLGKGMAGQAIQAMNIALGLPETAGLWHAGRHPG